MAESGEVQHIICPHCQHALTAEELRLQVSAVEVTCAVCAAVFRVEQIVATLADIEAKTGAGTGAVTSATTLSDVPTLLRGSAASNLNAEQSVEAATAPTLISDQASISHDNFSRNSFGIESAASERRFQVRGEIARGGMGAILESRDVYLHRDVAMKVILGSSLSQTKLRRFVEEAQITGQLEHPSIVPVHELGVDLEGKFYYTMKMVHGQTLKDILQALAEGKAESIEAYPLARLLDIFNRICDALSFAHSKGIIHRDLKPENIMIGDFGEVQVMDWGLAKRIGQTERNSNGKPQELVNAAADSDSADHLAQDAVGDKTLEGHIVGTPQFMAPEQARGEIGVLCPQTDIYALGAILYQILTLRPPVSGRSIQELLNKVVNGEITPPLEYNSSSASRGGAQHAKKQVNAQRAREIVLQHCPHSLIPVSLSAVCMRAMQTKIEDRYATALELQKDIQAYQQGFATKAEAASAFRQVALLIKRHKAACSLIAGSVLIIILLTLVFVYNLQVKERFAVEEQGKAQAAKLLADQERAKAESALASAEYNMYRMAIKDAKRLVDETLFSDAAQTLATVNPALRHWEYYHLQERIATRSLQNLQTLNGHTSGITVMKFAPDGHSIASGSNNGQVIFWDLRTGRTLRTLQFEQEVVINDLHFSPDGKLVAVADATTGISIWGVDNGTLIKQLEGVPLPAISVAFTPDGKQLVGAGIAWNVQVWDVATWEQKSLFSYEQWVSRMALLPDAKHFALVHGNASLGIYELATSACVTMISRDVDYLPDNCLVFTNDGSKMISAGEDKKIKVWDVKSGALLKEFIGHASMISSLALTHDERYVASGSHDHTIRLWDMESGEVVHIDQGHSDTVTGLVFTADDSQLLSAALDKTIKQWKMPHVESRIALQGKQGLLEHVQFTKDASRVLTTTDKDDLQIWETATGVLLKNLGMWQSKVWQVKFSPDEKDVAIFGEDSRIVIVDVDSGAQKKTLEGHTQWPRVLEYAPSGLYLASACSAPSFKIWNCETGDLLHDLDIGKDLSMVCFSPNSKLLAVAAQSSLSVYDVETAKCVRTFNGALDRVGKIIFTHDGSRVITGSWDHLIKVWNVKSGECEMTMKGHYSFVDLLELTADGKRLFTGSYDNTVIIWDMETGAQLFSHKVESDLMGSKLSGDGKRLYVVLDDSTIEVLRAPLASE